MFVLVELLGVWMKHVGNHECCSLFYIMKIIHEFHCSILEFDFDFFYIFDYVRSRDT